MPNIHLRRACQRTFQHAASQRQPTATAPVATGIVIDGHEGRPSQQAFLRDFAGDLPSEKVMVLYAVQ